jgi:hypothetical protein
LAPTTLLPTGVANAVQLLATTQGVEQNLEAGVDIAFIRDELTRPLAPQEEDIESAHGPRGTNSKPECVHSGFGESIDRH